jgi:solute carrier family 13 (sodium-dependent dicarboxylate transporter), member 2/3/5
MDPLIRNRQEAVDAVETYSPAEQQFNQRRKTIGLFLAPLLFVVMLTLPMPSLTPQAHRLAAILVLVVTLWVSEALPLAVSALLGPLLAIVLRVAPAPKALASFADPIIFLFIGSFIIAEAMYTHGLDRRIAFTALSSRLIGRSAGRLLLVFGGISVVLSMWISNTATAAMMFPIGLSIVSHLSTQPIAAHPRFRRFSTTLMLITAFGASIGGMATPIGTPPNLIGVGMLRELVGAPISFFRWMMLGLPISLTLYAVLATGFWFAGARGLRLPEGTADLVRDELKRLGRVSRAQRNVMFAFLTTVLLWVFPGLLAVAGLRETAFGKAYESSMPEAAAALTGAILLFILPVDWRQRRFTMTWAEAVRIDWGTVFLFGGGLALGSMAFSSGLAASIGQVVSGWVPSHHPLPFTILFTCFAALLSEMTSNTASASMIVPIAIAVSRAAGISPLEPALGATIGASICFMLPVSTPPNAIAYSSGHVPIGTMIRYGVGMSAVACLVIITAVSLVGPLLF